MTRNFTVNFFRLKEAQKREQELERLRPEQVNCVALRTQLEKKFKEIDDLKEKLKEDNQKLKTTNEELESLGEIMHAFSIRDDVFQIDNLNNECIRLEKSIEDFQKQVRALKILKVNPNGSGFFFPINLGGKVYF